jgi:DNA-binding response OmpR family regulator
MCKLNLILSEEKMVELTTREFNLLEYLMRSPGRVFTRTQILEHVWGYDFNPNTNVVDVCIQRIRKKIDHFNDFRMCQPAPCYLEINYLFPETYPYNKT